MTLLRLELELMTAAKPLHDLYSVVPHEKSVSLLCDEAKVVANINAVLRTAAVLQQTFEGTNESNIVHKQNDLRGN